MTNILFQSLDSTLNIGFGRDDLKCWPVGALEVLLNADVLRKSDYARSVVCRECPDECSVEVRFIEGEEGGEPRAFFDCPRRDDIGRVRVALDELQTYSLSVSGMAAVIAGELGGTAEELMLGRLWTIGRVDIGGARTDVWLARGLRWPDGERVLREARSRKQSQSAVVLSPTWVESDGSLEIVPLNDVLRLDGGGLSVDVSVIREAAERAQAAVGACVSRLEGYRYLFKEGIDTWAIVYDGVAVHPPLKNTKGLRYLAFLLAHPSQEGYYALQIVHEVDGTPYGPDETYAVMSAEELDEYGLSVSGFTDAGEIMDSEYEKDCRNRLKKAQEELKRAETHRDAAATRQAKSDIEQYRRALREGIGLSGRHRATGNASEKARVAVTQAIGRLLKKLQEQHPTLYEHLHSSLQTGSKCSYNPSTPIDWNF